MPGGARRAWRENAEATIAARNPVLVRFFAGVFTRAIRKDFHALRVSRAGPMPAADTPHLVIYANHPSWWDGALYNALQAKLFEGRAGFAPIDAAMLDKYRFMRRIGAIGVEQGSRAGAAAYLAACSHVLEDPERILWIAAQGHFADARERPVPLAPGLAHLAKTCPQAVFVPLAVEYTFWDERQPEALIRFGAPVAAANATHETLRDALTTAMDALAGEAIARDGAAFETLISGASGVGGVYDAWGRAKALLAGRRFEASHGAAMKDSMNERSPE